MNIFPFFRVRGGAQPYLSEGTDAPPHINIRGEQICSNGLPLHTQLVALGNSFQVMTATAAAPVVAIPTTAALLGLWNGEADNGKWLVIDSVFALTVASTAAQQSMSILCNVSAALIPTAIANTLTPRALRAGGQYRGNARAAVGVTLNATDGVATNWFPVGSTPPAIAGATNNIGTSMDIDVKGRILIPPKGQLSLTVISSAATASSVQLGVRWHELLLPPSS